MLHIYMSGGSIASVCIHTQTDVRTEITNIRFSLEIHQIRIRSNVISSPASRLNLRITLFPELVLSPNQFSRSQFIYAPILFISIPFFLSIDENECTKARGSPEVSPFVNGYYYFHR